MATPQLALNLKSRSPKAQKLESYLLKHLVGQRDAIAAVVDCLEVFFAGLGAEGKPVGNVLFLGPTGTGKTHLAQLVAEATGGDKRALLRVDCAEFQHSHEIAKLVGSPPGYLGHRETHPVFTQEKIDNQQTSEYPVTFVLFDEIEKASDSLWQLLLGVLDNAMLTLGDSRKVDFSKVFIFFTSNLGAQQMQELLQGSMGFATAEKKTYAKAQLEAVTKAACQRKFSPEFMNRIDRFVTFELLTESDLESILELELAQLQNRLTRSTSPCLLEVGKGVKEVLLLEGYEPRYGARHMKRTLEQRVMRPLARMIGAGEIQTGDLVRVKKGFQFTREPYLQLVAPKAKRATVTSIDDIWPTKEDVEEMRERKAKWEEDRF